MLTHKTTHEAQGQGRVLWQFRNAVRFKALLRSLLKQVQDLENATFEVLLLRLLPVAEGKQLTILGKLVGQPRYTPDDIAFRLAIQLRVIVNRSSGEPETMIQIVRLSLLLVASTAPFAYREEPPHQQRLTIYGPLPTNDLGEITVQPAVLSAMLNSADGAATRTLLVYGRQERAEQFVLADGATEQTGKGWGSTTADPVDPGFLTSVSC